MLFLEQPAQGHGSKTCDLARPGALLRQGKQAVHVLVVEDDILLGEAIHQALIHWSHAVTWVRNGREGAVALREGFADIVLLDLGLPDKDGLDVLAEARRAKIATPVLIMTAREAVEARVSGLDAGADDYLVKPFDLEELGARIRSLTRRAQGLAGNRIEVGELSLDLGTHQTYYRGEPVELTRREFAILRTLMERAEKIVRRESLENSIFGLDGVQSNTLEVQIHSIRRKLSPDLIRTVRGVGYMITRGSS